MQTMCTQNLNQLAADPMCRQAWQQVCAQHTTHHTWLVSSTVASAFVQLTRWCYNKS